MSTKVNLGTSLTIDEKMMQACPATNQQIPYYQPFMYVQPNENAQQPIGGQQLQLPPQQYIVPYDSALHERPLILPPGTIPTAEVISTPTTEPILRDFTMLMCSIL